MDTDFFTPDKPHLKKMANAYQRVSNGLIKKLIITAPPRAGKSYITSLWVSWEIGRGAADPNTSIMRNCYGANLAGKFSYDIRDIVQTDKYLSIFPDVALKLDHRAIDDWSINGAIQSTYFCAGVGGGVTGKGCKTAAISDDLIKNLEEALSPVILDKIWGWYMSTHKSRLEAGCPEIHITTRWSKRDPVGRILEKEPDDWEVVTIKALDDNNRSFCEKVKSTEEYLELKALLDSSIWETEFQQNPVELKGGLYPANELQYFTMDEIAKYLDPKHKERPDSIIGVTDTADEGTDYLSGCTAVLIGQFAYITNVIFTQDPIEVTMPMVAKMILEDGHKLHQFESNNGGKGFALTVRDLTAKAARAKGILPPTIKWQKTVANKETRILMSSGQVKAFCKFRSDYLPSSDYAKFMNNLTSYIKLGKNLHDDAADMMALLSEKLYRPKGVRFFNTSSQAGERGQYRGFNIRN